MSLTLVDAIGGNLTIRFEVVILFPGLVRADGAATLVVKATTGNLVGAGFLDFMGSNVVEGVHRCPSRNR